MADRGLARDQLRGFVTRLARPGVMHNVRQGIYREARVMGFDPQALKIAVMLHQAGDDADMRELWATVQLYVEKGLLP